MIVTKALRQAMTDWQSNESLHRLIHHKEALQTHQQLLVRVGVYTTTVTGVLATTEPATWPENKYDGVVNSSD